MQGSLFTPQKAPNSEMQSTQKTAKKFMRLPGDAESVVMNALMEKARYSRINESGYRARSPLNTSSETKRGPSTELRECLRSKGFVVEGDRALYRK